jgi:hypothetical protein
VDFGLLVFITILLMLFFSSRSVQVYRSEGLFRRPQFWWVFYSGS